MKKSANPTKTAVARRDSILLAAKWCFLNFGLEKTSLEDIAKRAKITRSLIYRFFKGKEDIFQAVFKDWLLRRHPAAQETAGSSGDPLERLLTVCRIMVVEPWRDMVAAPMGNDFYNACGRIDPESDALHRDVALRCFAAILGDEEIVHVFILALDGLLSDEPTPEVLEQRIKILAARFVPAGAKKPGKSKRSTRQGG